MKPISQRVAKVSIMFNIILSLACLGLLIYSLLQKTVADQQMTIALKHKMIADSLYEVSIQQKAMADSAIMVALRQHDLSLEILDSLKLKNKTK